MPLAGHAIRSPTARVAGGLFRRAGGDNSNNNMPALGLESDDPVPPAPEPDVPFEALKAAAPVRAVAAPKPKAKSKKSRDVVSEN